MKYICEQCRNQVTDSQKFCGNCGSQLEQINDRSDESSYNLTIDELDDFPIDVSLEEIIFNAMSEHWYFRDRIVNNPDVNADKFDCIGGGCIIRDCPKRYLKDLVDIIENELNDENISSNDYEIDIFKN